MEFKEIITKTTKELHKLLSESREKLRDLRFKDGNKQLKNVREIRQVRKLIAQVFTLINKDKVVK
ncbi:MAG: 50S ribosomal protein L29 [bacterium]|nr:50S ribosomal protein L29 [bacterium]